VLRKSCEGPQKHHGLHSRTAEEREEADQEADKKGILRDIVVQEATWASRTPNMVCSPDLCRPSDVFQEGAACASRALNNHLNCSWRGIDEVCNGKLVCANLFGYSTQDWEHWEPHEVRPLSE
jgi:hypothetical protein